MRSRKRFIFALLWDGRGFVLSRNFRHQYIGNLEWLQKFYRFSDTFKYIDELIILNVGEDARIDNNFTDMVRYLTAQIFTPVAIGGGIRSSSDAESLFASGADKIIVNSLLFDKPSIVRELSNRFGSQAIIGCIDLFRNEQGKLFIKRPNGIMRDKLCCRDAISRILDTTIGELMLQSVDADGSGQGLDLEMLEIVDGLVSIPLIIAGGAGNSSHILTAFNDSRVDAVVTANLLNFVGDGLRDTRDNLIKSGCDLPIFISM